MARELTFACGNYDRTRPLIDGRVKPEGLELNCIVLQPHEIWTRMLNHYEFDASEMSLSSYLIARSTNKPLIAIPVFPARAFRHSSIFVNVNSGIKEPQHLAGKRVAQAEFQQTATVWARAILANEYEVSLQSIKWFHWYRPRTPIRLHKEYSTEELHSAEVAERMLASGELDAMIAASTPSVFLRGSSNVRRLFVDSKAAETQYFERTKIFPIMHTVVIKEEVWQKQPWIATSLFKAFQKAKAIAYESLNSRSAFPISLAWIRDVVSEQKQVLGDDPWSYGFESNRHVMETLIQHLFDQGLLPKKFKVEKVFAVNTLDF